MNGKLCSLDFSIQYVRVWQVIIYIARRPHGRIGESAESCGMIFKLGIDGYLHMQITVLNNLD